MDTHTMDAQTEQTATESHTQVVREVSWDNIGYSNLAFSGDYKVCLGTAGQLVMAIGELATQLETKLADSTIELNEYQKSLYPSLRDLAQQITECYNETFIDDVNDAVQLQVFGANLNGIYNNGTLRHIIATSRIPRGLCYKYAQFGQLLKVLTQRLEYIATRETDGVERYRTDEVQRENFVELQARCAEFVVYLNGQKNDEGIVDITDSVIEQWNTVVENARTAGGVTVETQRANRKERRAKLAEKRVQYRQARSQEREQVLSQPSDQPERKVQVRIGRRRTARDYFEREERNVNQHDYVQHCNRLERDYEREPRQQYRRPARQYEDRRETEYRPRRQQYRDDRGEDQHEYREYREYRPRPRFQHGDSYERRPNYSARAPAGESNESNRPQSFGRFPLRRQYEEQRGDTRRQRY
jgi:hypothetical protein